MKHELACEYWDLEVCDAPGGAFGSRIRYYSKETAFKGLTDKQSSEPKSVWRLRHVRQELYWIE